MTNGVIFDFDGVIIDTEVESDECLRELVSEMGGVPPVDLSRFRGEKTERVWAILKEEFNLSLTVPDLVDRLRAKYWERVRALPKFEPVKGIPELLARIQSVNIPIALATGASTKRIEIMLPMLDLQEVFRSKACAEDVQQGKPAPDLFLLAAERMSVPPSECVVIEDAQNGVLAAHAAGMKCIGFKGLPHNLEDLSTADLIVTDFDEITIPVLKGL